jgi:hypothetical protein
MSLVCWKCTKISEKSFGVEMNSNLGLIGFLQICAIVMVPFMVGVIWLLPKFLNGKIQMKMIVGAMIGSSFMVFIVSLVGSSGIQIKNSWPTVALTAIIWGIGGFLMGIYYDLRLLSKLGLNYYQKPLRSAYALGYGIVGAVISLPLGVVSGWIIMTWGTSFVGISLSGMLGAVFGGLFGWILGKVVKR